MTGPFNISASMWSLKLSINFLHYFTTQTKPNWWDQRQLSVQTLADKL